MSERFDEERFRKALNSFGSAADRAWQRRTCLAPAQYWSAALELTAHAPTEQQHLAECPSCRQRAQEVRKAAGAAGNEPARILVAAEPLEVGAGTSKTAARTVPLAQQLTFPTDPQLAARFQSEKQGSAVLEMEHSSWPPATLVRVMVAAKDAVPCETYLAPFGGKEGRVTARVNLSTKSLARTAGGFLHIQQIAPPELTNNDVPMLSEAMARAAKDAIALAAWQQWAKAVLKADKLAAPVRRAVVQTLRELGSPPTAAGR